MEVTSCRRRHGVGARAGCYKCSCRDAGMELSAEESNLGSNYDVRAGCACGSRSKACLAFNRRCGRWQRYADNEVCIVHHSAWVTCRVHSTLRSPPHNLRRDAPCLDVLDTIEWIFHHQPPSITHGAPATM